MQQMDFYLSGNLVGAPFNWKELMIELSFENIQPLEVLNTNQLVWKGDQAKIINDWFNNSQIFEGVPLVIKICSTQEVAFEGIVDLTDPSTLWNCDIVKVKIRDRRMDMVSALFDSIGFDFLATLPVGTPGRIDPRPISAGGDYVVIPYQINHIPDYLQVFPLALTIYNIAEKIKDIVHKLVAHIQALGSAPGVGAFVLNLLLIQGYILYLIAMIIVIIQLLIAAFDNLISPVYTKLGMYANTLIQRACEYFNIGWRSHILQDWVWKDLILMPEKQAWPINNSLTRNLFNAFLNNTGSHNRRQYDDTYNLLNGGLAYGYMDGTCGDLMRALSTFFNAKGKVIMNSQGNPVLNFERWDYNYNLSQFQFPNISEQAPFKQAFSTNASEIPANLGLRYARDPSDENTYDNYQGTSCMSITSVTNVNVIQNITLKHLKEKNFIFAHATRKDRNTVVEELLIPAWQLAATIANPIINFINNITSFLNQLNNMLHTNYNVPPPIPNLPANPNWSYTGHMLLTSHTTGAPKAFLAGPKTANNFYGYQGVQISANNRSTTVPSIAARSLQKYFHFSDLGLTVNPGPPYTTAPAGSPYFNQYYVYKAQKMSICCTDFDLIKNNNIAKTYDGQDARIDSVPWNIYKGLANIDYRVQTQYCKNLSVKYVVDGAETLTSL